ncbi:hypothetical protein SAMN04487866_11551 [Thermoactinomyces sp. DSM 45891]|uniref:hypothetical protein n=1 Tax=Thermoactinomyces sp. DSM 45891 TaxID=1761907 RepID=UPI00091163C2|nr:hypothetical protein [Thermoactinomyces sp. DSM 45891]SFX65189.1 hypothetical protein SAMN04487866_11551 [Thermoactinomyces sp. DSM 45891]
MESLAYVIVGFWLTLLFIALLISFVCTRFFFKWRYLSLLISFLIPMPLYMDSAKWGVFLFFGGIPTGISFLTIWLTTKWMNRKQKSDRSA